MSKILIVVALLLTGGATVAGSFFAGHVVSTYKLPTHQFLHDRGRELVQIVRWVKKDRDWDLDWIMEGRYAAEIKTIFLRLRGDGARVPVEREGNGGGMTSFGDTVLLVTHEGRIFSARSANDVRETSIKTPDSGFDGYVGVSEMAEYQDYDHANVFGSYRYNDLLFFDTPAGRGLAVSYTEFDDDAVCYRNAIATLSIDEGVSYVDQIEAEPGDWNILYRSDPCLPLKHQRRAIEPEMAGGRMVFSPPFTIYTANGDYHWDGVQGPEAVSQNSDMDYGKVVSIDLETGEARNISSGHRNVQGIALDRKGQLWTVEHGSRGGDELNRIVEGNDYGWPQETLGTSYDGTPWPLAISYGHHDIFTAPTFAWLPSVAISAMTRIEGFDDSWDGDLLMGSLKDLSLHRIRIRDDRVKFVEPIHIGKRLRHVHQHTDGRLVLWTDDHYLIFMMVSDSESFEEFVDRFFDEKGYDAEQSQRVREALDGCMKCHSFEPNVIGNTGEAETPNLSRVYGKPIASSDFKYYSTALTGKSGRWTSENLEAFLTDPQGWVPGTLMQGENIDDPFVVTEIVGLLEELAKADE
ncbi:PQQ-dependent sugar dehydrogenase [Halomonas ramblicola]|uniref:PQQ-dependent sugar dehydrogenase n=1 Tax=Halomonas ramblicola TaxID=747349 RepID=UPI0025B399CD|nr:PQQ-dependent sugar dehydrogenase [Halomonas ramblicola]MDN3522059.1 PQQ-dependent sugar dehydrogenase [Halomonas ramblicola]